MLNLCVTPPKNVKIYDIYMDNVIINFCRPLMSTKRNTTRDAGASTLGSTATRTTGCGPWLWPSSTWPIGSATSGRTRRCPTSSTGTPSGSASSSKLSTSPASKELRLVNSLKILLVYFTDE